MDTTLLSLSIVLMNNKYTNNELDNLFDTCKYLWNLKYKYKYWKLNRKSSLNQLFDSKRTSRE